ncbi:MAG: bifunctional DNA-formamidopyrimidine glycosylase/DNA-(apurinic or apyrimidinic site) lyase [Alphaproteobacteria bacterium]|nr:bifunctional DNA-formamidopyrimidine glycosylase/DNA-(apurinic or apyrimidinic site) lyase [Alphaproteobacteria bacterium]
MPELPEVETVRRALAAAMEDRQILHAHVGRPDLRWPLPDRLASRLEGRVVGGLQRRGKYVLLPLDQGETMLLHLGMSGSIRIHQAQPPIGKHDHIVLTMGSGMANAPESWIVLNDPRRFGWLDLYRGEVHPMLVDMGPEPLGNSFSADHLVAALAGRKGPIKTALLDQALVAGIGNIYACEALFMAGLSPRRKAGTIRGGRADRLVAAIRSVLASAIEDGGTSLRDHVQPGGEIGYFVQRLTVYGRDGQLCGTCGATIRRITQSGRSSFYCPDCQR